MWLIPRERLYLSMLSFNRAMAPKRAVHGLEVASLRSTSEEELAEFADLCCRALDKLSQSGGVIYKRIKKHIVAIYASRLRGTLSYVPVGKVLVIDVDRLKKEGDSLNLWRCMKLLALGGLHGRLHEARIAPVYCAEERLQEVQSRAILRLADKYLQDEELY